MPATKLNLKKDYRIEQGADYGIQFTVVDEDGELWPLEVADAFAAQVRETKDSASSIAFTSSFDTTTSVVTLTMADTVTATFTYWGGYWDCEFTDDSASTVTRLLEGTVEIVQQVTQ